MNNIFDFTKEPGKVLKKIEFEKESEGPVISAIVPFYNDKDYIEQTIYSILNQTFPSFELLIIDDGSKDEESLEKLKEIEKLDSRIKVYHKENEGLAATRDYGASKSSKSAKYLFFIDADDFIEPTYLECTYWALETNKDASWAYTDSIGFEAQNYTWNKWFDSETMKRRNDLVSGGIVRKEAFLDVNGYELREKAVNEDWNFWLKLIAKERYPVRLSYYGFWYRRKLKGSELLKSRENHKRAMEIISATASTIKKKVEAIQYPKYDYDWDIIEDKFESIRQVKRKKNGKINLLFIIPWMIMGGADKFNMDLLKGLNKEKFDVTLISTEPAVNQFRQTYNDVATVYDLTTFLDQKYWVAFINYIIEKNNIDVICNTNSELGYLLLPNIKANYPEIPIIDYIHMEEWYNRNGGYSRDSSGVSSVIDKTLTCNANSSKILEEHFKRNPDELETVYIGVDEKKFNPENYDKEEIRKELEITKKYVIGYICRITEQKRPMLLVEIIKKLAEERNDFIFLIVGDGNMLHEFKKKISRNGLERYVKYMGNTKDPRKLYAACDMTLNCSIKEGVALTSYESLSMGVPVISSDVGGQKELISEDVGIIVPCKQDEKEILNFEYEEDEINLYVNAINEIIEKHKKYSDNCRKKILNGFTINQMVEKMEKIFISVKENPNKTKIENGKKLKENISICKNLITEGLLQLKEKYTWECIQYNLYFGLNVRESYKKQQMKETMWKHKSYRGFIKFLQKTGLMRIIKKVAKR